MHTEISSITEFFWIAGKSAHFPFPSFPGSFPLYKKSSDATWERKFFSSLVYRRHSDRETQMILTVQP